MASNKAEILLATPSEDLARVISVVGAAELELHKPVTVQYANRVAKVSVESLIHITPRAGGPLRILEWSYGPLWVQLQGGVITEESKIGLSALGLYQFSVVETHENSLIERFLDAVRLVVLRYEQFEPCPTEVRHPTISYEDLRSHFKECGVLSVHLDDVVDLVAMYLKRDLFLFLGSGQTEGKNWKQEIHAGIEQFQGIGSFPDYLARIVDLLEPPEAAVPAQLAPVEAPSSGEYEVALSFAGEERPYVEEVAKELKLLGVRAFYDKHETAYLWGRHLNEAFETVYSHAPFVVMFVSSSYVNKAWPTHERRTATTAALLNKRDSVLPVRFDDTPVPGLGPEISFVSSADFTATQLAALIVERIRPEGDTGEAEIP
jgi:TIR domain